MTKRDDLVAQFRYEILNHRGTPFLRSARPRTLAQIKADPTLCHQLRQYRHRAWIEGGGELEHLPEFPQVERRAER